MEKSASLLIARRPLIYNARASHPICFCKHRNESQIQEPKLIHDAMQRNLGWFERYVLGNAAAAAWHTP